MLTPGTTSGNGAFWDFPRGTMIFAHADMANTLAGYLYFIHAPWGWPLLQTPLLGAPHGTNIPLVDAAPLIALLGKLWFSITGQSLNFLGFFALACFALPGVAMTILLAKAGERNLAAAPAARAMAAGRSTRCRPSCRS